MKRFYITSIIVAALAGMPHAAWAQDFCASADKTYNGPTNHVWQKREYWAPEGIPEDDDIVCIPEGKFVIIAAGVCVNGDRDGQDCFPETSGPCPGPGGYCNTSISTHAEAKAVLIQEDEEEDCCLELNPHTKLTLHGDAEVDSVVDNVINLFCDTTLEIAAGLTITGSGVVHGRKISGDSCSDDNLPPALIRSAVGTDFTLTLDGTVVMDQEMVVDVSLHNNAYVIANRSELRLQGGQKSGSGYWIVREDHAVYPTLVLDAPIELEGASWYLGAEGSGEDWRIESPGSLRVEDDAAFSNWNGLIQMSADGAMELNRPSATTWDFLLTSGTLKVIEDFDTSGDLEMTGGKIIVTAGKTAFFD